MAALASAAPAALASTRGAGESPAALDNNPNSSVTPNPTTPGTATTFVVSCNSLTAGGNATAATLVGTPMGLPADIPMQQGSQPNQFVVTVNLPQTIGAGSFSPDINCNNGVTQTVNIQVNAVPGQAPATGDGTTSTATDSTLMVAGLSLLAAASVGGGLVLRRRSGRRT
jgi:hypothetical protein